MVILDLEIKIYSKFAVSRWAKTRKVARPEGFEPPTHGFVVRNIEVAKSVNTHG